MTIIREGAIAELHTREALSFVWAAALRAPIQRDRKRFHEWNTRSLLAALLPAVAGPAAAISPRRARYAAAA